MSTFSARKPRAPSVKLDFTTESPKIVEFLERNGVSGQASAGIGGTHSQELMVTVQVARVRAVYTMCWYL